MTSSKKRRLKSAQPDYLFEISWEVCNKIGGIYTVLKSKAREMVNIYDQNYYLIGPYFSEKIKGYFQEEKFLPEFEVVFKELKKKEIVCYSGKWLIEGTPRVILIDFKGFWHQVNQIKTQLWEDYKIDSLKSSCDFDEPVLWAWTTGILIEAIIKTFEFQKKKIVVQFHEWLSGAGLLYLKKNKIKVGTVFSTHATVLGRTLSGHDIDFRPLFSQINPEEESKRFNIIAKHHLEKKAAQYSDIFTTVSEITAFEAEYFLGRKPDFLLLNGLDLKKFLNFEEIVIKHRIQREKLKEFLLFYFFPYYTFDLDKILFYFITGRYEFWVKGIDVFIKALAQLNQKLINKKSKKTIIVFFWIPADNKGIKSEVLVNRELVKDIKDSLEEVFEKVKRKILFAFTGNQKITEKILFEKEFLFELKKKIMKLKKSGLPPITTHNLINDQDLIFKLLEEVGLTNKEEDRVKVIFQPIYLTGHDGLTNLNYQESIQACHLGIFPSFYEPWGYTPLETAALGVSSITTDLTGFGRFCQKLSFTKKPGGVFILKRANKSNLEIIKELANFLYRFSRFSRKERIENKIQARKIASQTKWKIFIKNYLKAHDAALKKIYEN